MRGSLFAVIFCPMLPKKIKSENIYFFCPRMGPRAINYFTEKIVKKIGKIGPLGCFLQRVAATCFSHHFACIDFRIWGGVDIWLWVHLGHTDVIQTVQFVRFIKEIRFIQEVRLIRN